MYGIQLYDYASRDVDFKGVWLFGVVVVKAGGFVCLPGFVWYLSFEMFLCSLALLTYVLSLQRFMCSNQSIVVIQPSKIPLKLRFSCTFVIESPYFPFFAL